MPNKSSSYLPNIFINAQASKVVSSPEIFSKQKPALLSVFIKLSFSVNYSIKSSGKAEFLTALNASS